MPISDVIKNLIGEVKEKAEETNEEPEPIENPHDELFDDDTEVEHVQDRDQ